MLDKTFILGGKAIFTLEVSPAFQAANASAKPHYTYKVTHKAPTPQYPNEKWFVALLTGPDNTNDYQYQGMLDAATGIFIRGKKALPETCHPLRLFARTMKAIWEGRSEQIEAAGFSLHHEGRCGCCGRRLTTPASIELGIGPECAAKRGLGLAVAAVHAADEDIDLTAEQRGVLNALGVEPTAAAQKALVRAGIPTYNTPNVQLSLLS